MLRPYRLFFLALCLIFAERPALADCSKIKTYASTLKTSSPQLLILPFQGDASAAPVVTVLLREYLTLGADFRRTPSSQAEASYILTGKVSKSKSGDYLVQTSLQSAGTKKDKAGEIGRWEGAFQWGNESTTLNDMMVGLTMKIAEALHKPL